MMNLDVGTSVRAIIFGLTAFVIAFIFDHTQRHSNIQPIKFNFPQHSEPLPNLTHFLTSSTSLFHHIKGAESFVEDPATNDIYTGLANGQIVRFHLPERNGPPAPLRALKIVPEEIVRLNITSIDLNDCNSSKTELVCGRALGLALLTSSSSKSLIVCDGTRGLLKINLDHDVPKDLKIEVLTSTKSLGGIRKLSFCNSVDVSVDEETVYFTDSSRRNRAEFLYDVLEGRPTGRFFKYDFRDLSTKELVPNISFANGVVRTHQNDGFLVVELMKRRIWKYHTEGNKAGLWKVWGNYQFFPDNIQRSPDGESYLVGSSYQGSPIGDYILSKRVRLRRMLGFFSPPTLDYWCKKVFSNVSAIYKLNQHGGVEAVLYANKDSGILDVSEGFQTKDGYLLWGSFSPTQPFAVSGGFPVVQ